jgi:hypothetical protein
LLKHLKWFEQGRHCLPCSFWFVEFFAHKSKYFIFRHCLIRILIYSNNVLG